MTLTLIAAADEAWGIGIEERLPWHLPEDLRHFRTRTMGRVVVMGRKTYEGLPGPLPGRRIVALSREPGPPPYVTLAALPSRLPRDEESFVAGGAEVYRLLLPDCDRAEITRVRGTHAADARLMDLAEFGWSLRSETRLSSRATLEVWLPPTKKENGR